MSQKIVRTTCGMCHGGCGILAYVDDGRLVKVEGDKECPINKGSMCPIGLSATQLVYHPDRLKYPVKRIGQRGEGKWARISWDEALDTIAAKTKKIRDEYGPLSVVLPRGTGRPVGTHNQRYGNALDTVTLGIPNCHTPMRAAGEVTYGKFPAPDLVNAECILNVGTGSTWSRPGRVGNLLMDAIKRGAKLISIDPYLHPLVSKSDMWLQIRPGTDCAMALALLNVIIYEGLYDKEFVQKWTSGFDRLAEHVERFTPEWAEPITWVPAEKIRQAARMYATTKPAALHMGVCLEHGINVTNTLRCHLFLPAVTGNVDIPGGNMIWNEVVSHAMYYAKGKSVKNSWGRDMEDLLLGDHMYAMPDHMIWRTILTGKYPIKAALIHASNPILTHANARGQVYQAIMKLDFVSVMDLFMTPTAELADIVLPASTTFERDDVYQMVFIKNYVPPTLCASPKVIEPMWESRDDINVFIDVLKRMGLDYGASSVIESLDQFSLSTAGIPFSEVKEKRWISQPQQWRKYERGLLRRDGKPGFETPSGKIEIYSSELSDLGMDPLPLHKEPPESPVSDPALAKDYPLVLTTGIRSPVYFHTQYRQIPWLRKIHPDPIVRIHPQTAGNYGVKDGDWVYIESPRGRCKHKALLTIGIHPGIVLAEHAWWFPEKPAPEFGCWDANINVLTDSEKGWDPGLGSTPGRSLLCKIYKVEV